ncbi:MAG: hypothetical protein QOD55_1738 [Solirubrobacteraceae bacterium]|nr:hypothetical protein [Solirubrobacteraceae bacterium]
MGAADEQRRDPRYRGAERAVNLEIAIVSAAIAYIRATPVNALSIVCEAR